MNEDELIKCLENSKSFIFKNDLVIHIKYLKSSFLSVSYNSFFTTLQIKSSISGFNFGIYTWDKSLDGIVVCLGNTYYLTRLTWAWASGVPKNCYHIKLIPI